MTPIQSTLMVNSGHRKMFVKETSSSIIIETIRALFDSLWIQLEKFSFLTGWPPWLENPQSWIIKIGAEFIIQISLVLSERRLHEGQNHLFCDDKIPGFRDWFIEVWMSTDIGGVTILIFSGITTNWDFLFVTN